MNVFDLFATLSLDTSSYDEGLDKSEQKGSNFGKTLGNVVATGAKLGTAAIAATTAATVAGAKAFIDGVASTAEYADRIDKLSAKTNMSATSLQEWDFILQHCGTSVESMQASVKTLSNAAETGNEAFERLGISQEEIAQMSGEELFSATISALQEVSSETERTYLAGQLLGRGATELGALLDMSAEETEQMRQEVHDLNGVLSDEAVKSGAQFQDSLQNMQVAFTGMKNSMLTQFLPSFSTVMDGIAKVFSGDSDSGMGLIKSGVKEMASQIAKVAPQFIEIGGTILSSLATSVIQNAPVLIESGMNAMGLFVDAILSNIDGIIGAAEQIISLFVEKIIDPSKAAQFTQAAIDIILKLVSGITEALPVLLPAISSVIVAIVTTLTDPENLNMLIDCALQLTIAIANGIVDALPQLVAVIPIITMNLIEALIDNAPQILETVLYLLGALGYALLKSLGELLGQTLWEITESFSKMFSKAKDFGTNIGIWLRNAKDNVINEIKNFFINAANFFVNGFSNIKNKVQTNLDNIKNKFTSIFDNVKNVVRNAIEYVKGLFNFQWSLPKLKLPHFSITGQLDLFAIPPQIPSVSIEWYKKAMDTPYLLNDATIFGAANGKLLGAGESGSELVVGTDKLMSMMKQAVGGSRPITINIYGAQGQDIRLLAKEVSRELQNAIDDKNKVYA